MARKSLLNEKKNLLRLFSLDKPSFTSKLGIIDDNAFRDCLIQMLIQSEDPNHQLGMNYQYARSVIDLEIWLQEVDKGRTYLLDRARPKKPHSTAIIESVS